MLIVRHEAHELVVLGDFLHAAESRTPSLLNELALWRERHAALHCTLVRGNHDDRAGDPPATLDFQVVDEPWLLSPLAAAGCQRNESAAPPTSAPAATPVPAPVTPPAVIPPASGASQ